MIPNFLTETKERDGMKNGKKEEVEKSKKPEGNRKDKNGRKKEDFLIFFFCDIEFKNQNQNRFFLNIFF